MEIQIIISVDEKRVFYLYDNEIIDLVKTAFCDNHGLNKNRVSMEINVPPKKHGE